MAFPTLFESIPRSVSILNEITRGIQNGGDKTKLLKTYYKIKSHFTDGCSEVDRAAGDLLIRSLEKNPDFAFCVFLGIDTYSHQFHPFHKKVVDSYRLVDEYVGLIGNYLEKERRLEDTLIVLGSDHGLTPTHSHFDLLNFINDQNRKTFYYPNIFKHLFDADASCMVSGNAMAHLYFKTGNRWDNETHIEGLDKIVNNLLERQEVDLVLGKNSQGSITIKSRRGEAKTNTVNGKIAYKVVSSDPFGFSNIPNTASMDLLLEKTIDTNYPDVLVQINQLFDSARTGDLVISAANGFDLRAYHEKPEHCASHGSLLKEHMLVPLVLNQKINKKFVRTTDTYPTIMKFLDVKVDVNIDGTSLI